MKINLLRNLATNGAKIRVKKMSFAIAIIAMLTASMLFVNLQVNAKVYPDRTVGAHIAAAPKLVGVGQEMTINLMLWPALQDPTLYSYARETTAGFALENDKTALLEYYKLVCFQGITVTFTRPDGTKDTLLPVDISLQNVGLNEPGMMSLMGTTTFFYKPNIAGNWSVSFNFPGQTVTNEAYSTLNDTVYYKPSSSNLSYFTVQDDPVNAGVLNGWPFSPLPTGYWERPISIDNREWSQIGGAWPQDKWDGSSSYNPYSTAPSTAHIVWKDRMYYGGIVGGDFGSWSYNIRPIGAGAPYIVDNQVFVNDATGGFFTCFDLRTGEQLYRSDGTISNIWIHRPAYQTVTQTEGVAGAIQPVLIDTSTSGQWKLRAPFNNGAVIQTITSVASNLAGFSWTQGGNELYMYQRTGYNTTKPMQFATYNIIKWDYSKVTSNNWTTGVVWTTKVRNSNEFVPGDSGRSGFLQFNGAGVVVLCSQMENMWIGYDMSTGAELWRKTTDYIVTNVYSGGPDGPVIGSDPSGSLLRYQALDPKTGKQLWTSDPVGTGDWGGVPLYYEVIFGNGNMYIGGFDGYIYAISLADGKLVWKSDFIGDMGETIFNTWAFGSTSTSVAGDGKLYFSTGIVYSTQPLSRFHKLYCVDAATGKFLWTLSGLAGGQKSPALADGYLVYPAEDGTYYCFNKGKTETSISIQDNVIAKGGSALIEGSVLDMSPAQSGTPAVADEDMSMWMEYLHMQNATLLNNPPSPKGVPVNLWTIDPNNNKVDIGNAISDSSGGFKMLWTPTIEGTYTVYATFSGSESYWSSQGTTYVDVAAPAATSTNLPLSVAQDAVPYVIGVGIAIIIAIAFVGLLLLRKRP